VIRGRRLAVVALVAPLLLAACSGGGGGDDAATLTTLAPAPPPVPQVTTTAPPEDVQTFEVFSNKNPFTPLAGDQTGSGTGGTGSGGTGTGGTGGTGTGGTGTGGTGGTGTGGTTAPDGTTGGVEPQRAQRVALLDVFTEDGEVKANVRVNTTVHKVKVGQEFADRYKVLSLDSASECGRFLFGDDSFRLCRGEQALK
jgi:hypothetical protein